MTRSRSVLSTCFFVAEAVVASVQGTAVLNSGKSHIRISDLDTLPVYIVSCSFLSSTISFSNFKDIMNESVWNHQYVDCVRCFSVFFRSGCEQIRLRYSFLDQNSIWLQVKKSFVCLLLFS